ncbi:MAG: hypothetical protein OEQ28_10280, partial [Acidobacteriota bacterium]|nr:hypothetical protein [Acidobacteriota bacterium]
QTGKPMTMKTRGLEQFEHLNDKSSLLLFMLEDEAKEVSDLRDTVNALKRERNEIKRINADLQTRIDQLTEKRSEIDVKAGLILKALDESHLL